jgi:hypothetical protein
MRSTRSIAHESIQHPPAAPEAEPGARASA